ncbi:hypothetical protein BVX95_00265 [archaeon D22]|nr:hypothetical protein BVX95_00265 [archaeon D22]
MKITVSGKAGSGKSTIAKELARILSYKHYSMGDLQRELAKERGLTIEEWNIEQAKDSTTDNMIDDKMTEIGKTQDDFVIDAWLGANFVPDAIKIWLDVDIDEAIKRRLSHKREEESFEDPEEVKRSILNRAKVNQERWIRYYDFDYLDMDNYDIIVDTTNLNPEEIIKEILEKIKEK